VALPPNFTITTEGSNWSGFIAIDSLVNGTSSGGLRIAHNIDLSEVCLLSREMTLKFSFIGLSRGGAKSGVQMPRNIDPVERRLILEEFGRRTSALIRTGIYYPAMDLNCSEEDLRAVYRGAGLSLGKATDSAYFTALSVENSILACREIAAGSKKPRTIAIEGFGRVAAHLAKRLDPSAFRIIALSTECGGVERRAGFSPEELIDARRCYADDLVSHFENARHIDKQQVIYCDADILVPAARVRSILDGDVEAIRARFIVPAANAPYADGVPERLRQRGVTCLPGFAANCGGAFGTSLLDSGVSMARIEALGSTLYRDVVKSLLKRTQERNQSAIRVATEIALKHYNAQLKCTTAGCRLARLIKRALQEA
jgi:glutamate dehydrogenase (NAD(P)+)